ncbi:MAG: transposase [Candidatus Nealsonbacteria bacterium]|nr:transposase [Candidatus Nealsonbacteria bacterium]
MPIKRPPLVNGEIYHIVIRAVEGLKLFKDQKDYFRMIHDLFEFNDEKPTSSYYRQEQKLTRTVLVSLDSSYKRHTGRECLLEILAFCLMPNHAHLLVRQLRNGGISKFMRKIGAGYGGYYNKKYKRSGHLFQGKYKIVHVKDDKQLITVFVYIHTNPVAILVQNWKERGISGRKLQEIIEFLENYRWSSYSDYLGKRNFPSVTSREFLFETVGGAGEGQRFVNDWLQFKKELADSQRVAIE